MNDKTYFILSNVIASDKALAKVAPKSKDSLESLDTARFNNDGTKLVVKLGARWKGKMPPPPFRGLGQYTHAEILVELQASEWQEEIA